MGFGPARKMTGPFFCRAPARPRVQPVRPFALDHSARFGHDAARSLCVKRCSGLRTSSQRIFLLLILGKTRVFVVFRVEILYAQEF